MRQHSMPVPAGPPLMATILALACLPALVLCGWNKLPGLLPTEEGSLQSVPLGLPEVGHLVAVGHFSPDRRPDCLILDETRTQLYIYILKAGATRYSKSLAVATVPAGNVILNAVLTDLDHDGHADVLLMYTAAPTADKVEFKVYLGNGESLTESQWRIQPARGQPLLLDWDGSTQLAMLGVPFGSERGALTPSLWRNVAAGPDELSKGWRDPERVPSLPAMAVPNWNAQADFDGDGHADLLLMYSDGGDGAIKGFEIWLRSPGATQSEDMPYKLGMKKDLPPGTGPLTVADFDGDGHLDLLFAVCHPADTCSSANELHIVYNVQRRFCSKKRKDPKCRSIDDLLGKAEQFDFDMGGSGPDHVVLKMSALFPGQDLRVVFEDRAGRTPISMSVGDYDLDSYPDVVLTVADRQHPDRLNTARPALLRNVACEGPLCTDEQSAAERRTFREVIEAVGALRDARQVSTAAFVDWDGMGPPGFIVNAYAGSQPRHFSIRNGISRDAFSLRAETLNGVCPAPCKRAKTGARAERPSSVNFMGAMYRFSFVDPAGATQVRAGMQLSQTSNRALQSPTLLFGLGRTSNFIQTIEVGLNLRAGPTQYAKANIFPNSEVIFIPPHADSPAWAVELQIHPGEYIMYVFISVASALVVLAIITGIFKLQERREDELERKRHTHLVNFDAL